METRLPEKCEEASAPAWLEPLIKKVKTEASDELHAKIGYSVRVMLDLFRDELNSTIKQTTSNNMPVEDTVHDVNSHNKSTEQKSCQRCEQLTIERNQALAKLEAVRKLVDGSGDLAPEMQLLSQETGEPDSIYKQKIKEYQKRIVKLEETEAALAEVRSKLASLQKTVDHLTNVEKELVDCRIALATTQKSHEEVQHTADARAEEIRRLCSQLGAVTVKEESKGMIDSQDNTTEDLSCDNLSSTFEDVGKELALERELNEVQVAYESDIELVRSYHLEGLQSQHKLGDVVDNVPDVKGHAAFGNESVVEPKSYGAAEDLPLSYDEKCNKEDKSTTASLVKATNAIAMDLPPAITSFTRNQIISKNCSLSWANGADDFWLQLDGGLVCKLMSDIDNYSTKEEFVKLSTFQGTVGDACLALYKELETDPGLWHRAVVASVNGDVCTVFCVDFGNSFSVKMSELKSLPSHLAVQPPLAYRCTLDGIGSITNDVTEALVELFWMSTPVTAQFKEIRAGKLSVRLFRTSDNIDLNKKLGLPAS